MPMTNFDTFIKEIQQVLTLIKTSTGKVFIPSAISHSPVNPKSDLIVVFRASDTVTAFSLDGWFTEDIAKLSKKFIVKKLKLDKAQNATHMKVKITQQLHQFYADENLNLIGGFQDNTSTLNLLMFKEDTKTLASIEIVTELLVADEAAKSMEDYRRAVEETTNEGHLYQNGVLRCCITLNSNEADNVQLFVFQVEQDVDRIYMIMNFPKDFQDALVKEKSKSKTDTTKASQESFDEMMTRWINV